MPRRADCVGLSIDALHSVRRFPNAWCIAFCFVCRVTAAFGASPAVGEIADRFGGAGNLQVIATAAHVTASRLISPGDLARPETLDAGQLRNPRRYKARGSVPVLRRNLHALRSILLHPPRRDAPGHVLVSGCQPIYDVRFTFFGDTEPLVVDVCFRCKIFCVSRGGKLVGAGTINLPRAQLVGLRRALFPFDTEH